MVTKKKKYFKPNSRGVSTAKLSFLIRWLDDATVKNDGPFFNEQEAEETPPQEVIRITKEVRTALERMEFLVKGKGE